MRTSTLHLLGALTLLATATANAQTPEEATERVTVEANRLPDVAAAAPFSVDVIEGDQLRAAPQLRVDDILRAEIPGFSLFRRNSSRTANPTTQGVTLRNFGPSGAGRTLVLLDGVPLNDPFAGYVLWSEVPPAAIDSIVVQPGGGAGLFGNAALAGTIYLLPKRLIESGAAMDFSAGDHDTYDVSASGTIARAPLAIGVNLERFSTGGYPVIAAGQRGPVDRDADAESDVFDLRAEWQINADASLRVSARRFDDERGNGTAFTANETRGSDLSAVLVEKFAAFSAELQLSVYQQHRAFRSTFSSVNSARDVETPALDQFDVPADAAGGSAVWSTIVRGHRITIGGDARWVDGETNEAFLWNGAEFTRVRSAGGQQLFAGFFTEDAWSASDLLTIVGGLRVDHWALFDGFRKEVALATGELLRDSAFPDRDGNTVNGRLGARVQATKVFSVRAAAYTGFRVPTLNELYRPFRVGNDITEANPELKPERLLGGEAALEWQATSALCLSGTAFVNRLEDAVGNVTIGFGPGTFDPGGFVPAGGVLRQRRNIDLVLAPGFETTAAWQVGPTFSIRGSYLFTHPTIEQAADRSLEGKLLAQTPEHVVTSGVDWNPTAQWSVRAQMRYSDRQFEDDQDSRVLAPFVTFDGAISYQWSPNASCALRVENLLDAAVATGKSADGLVSIGAPRLVSLQFRYQL